MFVYLPFGKQGATFSYRWAGDGVASLRGPSEGYRIKNRPSTRDKQVELIFQVVPHSNGRDVALSLIVDGKSGILWNGPASKLKNDTQFKPPESFENIFSFSCPASMTIHLIDLRLSNR